MLESQGLRSGGRATTCPAVPVSPPPPLPHQTGKNLRILVFSEGVARCRAALGTSRQQESSDPPLGSPPLCYGRAERPCGACARPRGGGRVAGAQHGAPPAILGDVPQRQSQAGSAWPWLSASGTLPCCSLCVRVELLLPVGASRSHPGTYLLGALVGTWQGGTHGSSWRLGCSEGSPGEDAQVRAGRLSEGLTHPHPSLLPLAQPGCRQQRCLAFPRIGEEEGVRCGPARG